MIKINLIYDRKLVEINKIKFEFYLAVFFTFFVFFVIFFIWNLNNKKLEEVVTEVSEAQLRKSQLSSVEKKIKQFEEVKAKIDRRINAIGLLIDQKKGPARLFDELNALLPDEIWLTSLTLKGNRMQIDGYSYTDPGIAKFMENLKKGKHFSDVNLEGIDLQDINGEFFKKFTLNTSISLQPKI